MQCKNCSASLSMKERFCPYCGASNDEAQRQQNQLEYLEMMYADTRKEVLQQAQRHGKLGGKNRAIIILAAVNLVLIILLLSQIFSRLPGYIDGALHGAAYSRQMERCLDAGEYEIAYEYYSNVMPWDSKVREQYRAVGNLCTRYESIMNSVTRLAFYPSKYEYNTKTEICGRLASDIHWFYRDIQEDGWQYNSYTERDLQIIADMRSRLEPAFMTYCSLTEQDLEQLPQMKEEEVLILLHGRMKDEK